MIALGIELDMYTDPMIICEVLQHMKLDDLTTDHKSMKHFLKQASTTPQPLRPLLNAIKSALVHNHPAVIEFAEVALSNRWLQSSPRITYAIHVTYVLEELTRTMCASHDFFIEVQDFLRAKERLVGLDKQHLASSAGRILRLFHRWFFVFKAVTLDPTDRKSVV